ncbi:amino-acid N-acetyltransferase [Sulfuricystis multivorans]|uniref:amino-acid N-acetyltransferase n=1 Tax=Sulfuricystis multivorans TaxID=2211108 RepID=UPI001559CC0F
MMESNETTLTDERLVAWVRQAAPYIHAFRGRTFVIAFGGEALEDRASAQALIHDIALLDSMGIRLVLVHGARPQIDAEMAARGLPPRFHKGLRITDAAALECVKRALGVTRIEIEAMLSQGLPNTPLAGGFLRVTGGNFISAKPVGVVDGIDHHYTGAVRNVIAEEIQADLAQENVVLISPIGASPSGEIFNLAWEEVAEAVACAIHADKLIFLVDAPGLLDRKGERIDALTADEGEALLKKRIKQSPEVTRVLPGALRAVRGGKVGRVHFLDRRRDGAMLMEFFTRDGIGTVLTHAPLERIRGATIHDVAAILALIAPLEADGTLVKRGRERIEMEIERFSVLELDGTVVGCAALYPFSDAKAGELACLAVMPEYREIGYGDRLRRHIEQRAKQLGIKRLFVLTTRTAHWFTERGFVPTDVGELPEQRRELYNFQRRSKVLVKNL